jgi:hypothetical protein
VVRQWIQQLDIEGISNLVLAIFYADDGHLYSTDAHALQRGTEIIVELFKRMGLQTNTTKTQAMVCAPLPSLRRVSSPAYTRRMGTGDAPSYRDRQRQQIECDICQASIQAQALHNTKD